MTHAVTIYQEVQGSVHASAWMLDLSLFFESCRTKVNNNIEGSNDKSHFSDLSSSFHPSRVKMSDIIDPICWIHYSGGKLAAASHSHRYTLKVRDRMEIKYISDQ